MQLQDRFATASFMQEEWKDFPTFAQAGMRFLGYGITWMQADIAQYMQEGPRLRMVAAQRGEAKSTLAALYAVWRIVQQPSTIVLVVSGGEQQASEVANLIIRMIQTWDMLEYLKPDTSIGDRNSRMEFDVHYALKGLNKSPSVACVGITSTLQGKRANLLIPDDVETTKNSLTSVQRQQLLRLTQEFSSICTDGDILYLGTPQTKDSIYNTLERRGFEVRVWPGRYPTAEELPKYGSRLAPALLAHIQADGTLQRGGGIDGSRGKPADPDRYTEDMLQEKELDQGPEGFQLQYMLDTSLMDAARQQLRLQDLLVANFDDDMLPEVMVYQAHAANEVKLERDFPVLGVKLYHPTSMVNVMFRPRGLTVMCIDPAGGGTDELAFGVSTALGPYIHVLGCGGLKGGLTEDNGNHLVDLILEHKVTVVQVESNMGHGLFETNLRAFFEKRKVKGVAVEGVYSTGQKERRIINGLVGAMQRHKVVVHPRVFKDDAKYLLQHSMDKRQIYSLWYQLSSITTDRNSLEKDDRVEAFSMCVRYHSHVLAKDEEQAAREREALEGKQFMANPMGYADTKQKKQGRGISALLAWRNR